MPRTSPSCQATGSRSATASRSAPGVDSNSENGVVCSVLDGDPADILAWMGDAPAQWLVGAGSDLHDRLVAAGCRPERTAVLMGARLADLELGAPEGEPADAAEYRAVAAAVDFGEGSVGAQQRFVARRDGRAGRDRQHVHPRRHRRRARPRRRSPTTGARASAARCSPVP